MINTPINAHPQSHGGTVSSTHSHMAEQWAPPTVTWRNSELHPQSQGGTVSSTHSHMVEQWASRNSQVDLFTVHYAESIYHKPRPPGLSHHLHVPLACAGSRVQCWGVFLPPVPECSWLLPVQCTESSRLTGGSWPLEGSKDHNTRQRFKTLGPVCVAAVKPHNKSRVWILVELFFSNNFLLCTTAYLQQYWALFPGQSHILSRSCEIKSGSGLGMRLGNT